MVEKSKTVDGYYVPSSLYVPQVVSAEIEASDTLYADVRIYMCSSRYCA